MGVHHEQRARAPGSVGCGILIVSDSRTVADDASGAVIRTAIEGAGHRVSSHAIVPDERAAIRREVSRALARADVLALIVSGGTGIASRDVTIESLADLWAKELPGFGELLRALSYDEIGSAAYLSRATAGVIEGKFVVVLPGSPAACRLAMERLVLPELGHVAALLDRT